MKASQKALRYIEFIEQLQEQLKVFIDLEYINPSERSLLVHWFETELKAFEDDIRATGFIQLEPGLVDYELYGELKSDYAERYYSQYYKAWHTIESGGYTEKDNLEFENFINELGIQVDSTSTHYTNLRCAYFTLKSALFNIKFRRYAGGPENHKSAVDLVNRIRKTVESSNSSVQPTSPPQALIAQKVDLEQLVDEFLASKEREESCSAKTLEGYKESLKLLIQLNRNQTITKRSALDIKDKLQKLPSNMHKRKEYRELSIEEIIQLEDIPKDHLMSVTTINKYLRIFGSFTQWAIRHDKIELSQNPFQDLKLKERVSKKSKRKVFTPEKLNLLFSQPIWTKLEYKKDFHYWLPLLGLYTGARIDELCQLKISDVKEYHINDRTVYAFSLKDLELKTESSEREIPIHQHLIELGLLDYIDQLKQEGKVYLLHDITVGKSTRSDPSSKWFNRLKDKLGFEKEKECFHSFRHTLQDMVSNGVGEFGYKLKRILGHSSDDVTFGTYGQEINLKYLTEVYEKIDFKKYLPEIKPFK
ncbi:site-specific integrase [Kangiella japonica]